MAKFSFIIPVYNCEKYLEDCVASIMAQSCGDYEVLLIDDGSTDGSASICDRLAAQNNCVRVLHKSNSGAAGARNCGILEAKGEYLIFVDGDDRVDPCLLNMASFALCDNSQAMVIYGISFDYYYKDKYRYSENLSCKHEGSFGIQQVFARYQDFFGDNALSSACNKVFLREVILKNNIQFNTSMKLYEDYDFVLKYMLHINSVVCINKPLYRYKNDLESKKLGKRVRSIPALGVNLEPFMMSTSVAIGQYPQYFKPLADVACNLYMHLLERSLIYFNRKPAELRAELPAYCGLPVFRDFLEKGAELTSSQKMLLEQIDAEDFSGILRKYRKLHMRYIWKKRIKSALRFLGLYSR